MKAKIVNFERGQDPLDAMDLGIAKLKFTYLPTTSEGEYEVVANFGNFIKDDLFYTHRDDEQWDKLDKAEVIEEMTALEHLLSIAKVSKNGHITNYAAIVKMEEYLDHKLSELFGAETYNGWEYEDGDDCLGMKHEHAVIKIATYCIAKCRVFLDVMK